jgi:hypothetical protein
MALSTLTTLAYRLPGLLVLAGGFVLLAARGRDLPAAARALMWAGLGIQAVVAAASLGMVLWVMRSASTMANSGLQTLFSAGSVALSVLSAAGMACLILAPFRAVPRAQLRSSIPPSPLTPSGYA